MRHRADYGRIAARPQGAGTVKTLTIRGVMLIDGTGAPPAGPVNITVEGNRITRISSAGTPGVQTGRQGGAGAAVGGRRQAPAASTDQYVVDAQGMYLMPGFIDMHVHAGGAPKNAEAEYAYKFWLAHGVTTVRGVPMAGTIHRQREGAQREERNRRAAHHQLSAAGQGWTSGAVNTPEKAREWVRWAKANGVDGLKLGAEEPAIMAALLDEAKKMNMGSTAHLQQGGVAQMNAIKAARLGLHGDALLRPLRVAAEGLRRAALSRDMNATTNSMRFGQVARLWNKIYEPGTPSGRRICRNT